MSFGEHVDTKSILADGWEGNAAHQWGIPLYPLGELGMAEYQALAQDDLQETRKRSIGIFVHLLLNSTLGYIFVRNITRTVSMIRQRPDLLASWCCLIQALFGLVYAIAVALFSTAAELSCRRMIWIAAVGLTVSPICVGAALLQKAYMVHSSNKWLLVAGIVLLFPQPYFTYLSWTSPATIVAGVGCLVIYPQEMPWVKLALDAPINILFSAAFIVVIYRQYRRFGSSAWARLMRNGIQTMCLIVLSNVVCMLGVAFNLAGLFSELFFALDWLITSTLLVYHCATMANMRIETRDRKRSPSTDFYMRTSVVYTRSENLDDPTKYGPLSSKLHAKM
ncbi:hypothetical protein THASP1DRAFT_26300 [Thamnocephalis sphaerospora]|uniref:Uncharacterized protein n=1 Tax=Thamnocephalis sphaerospora TaxID=78915 RepID=A0A4P9XHQ8_9FUNG|nr:hypothetical protein THASP1DRAFT_26300 [Thamnocephalis sphaerospora]|eukprot:RKP05157.1 hypothetical protein THASP1DRAFT_26300 [Thamnocephalis sphaerospora]